MGRTLAAIQVGPREPSPRRSWVCPPVVEPGHSDRQEISEGPSPRRVFRAHRRATLDETGVHIPTLNPARWRTPPHQHPDEELIYQRREPSEALVRRRAKTPSQRDSVISGRQTSSTASRNVRRSPPATYHVIKWKLPGCVEAGSLFFLRRETNPLQIFALATNPKGSRPSAVSCWKYAPPFRNHRLNESTLIPRPRHLNTTPPSR